MRMALLAVVVLGCGGKKETSGNAPPPPNASELPPELAAWMPSNAVAAWQGAYTTRIGLRDPLDPEEVVLDVRGEGAKGFDGTKEYPLGFAIIAPCIAAFEQARTEGAMAGNTLTHAKQFVIKNGALIAAEGTVGMRKGKAAIACTYGAAPVITLDDKGVCKEWSDFPEWKAKPITCTWSTDDGKDVLTLGEGAGAPQLTADGTVLMDDGFKMQLERGFHVRHASYDAAKQALAANQVKRAE